MINSRLALKGIADEWDALAYQAGMPTLSHAWTLASVEAFHAQDDLTIITIRRKGELVGLAPLVQRRPGPVARLELIGVSFLYEPAGLLYRDDEALVHLVGAMVRKRLPLVLMRVPANSPVVSHLGSTTACVDRGFVLKGGIGYSLTIPITCEWRVYLEKLSSRRRYDLRRARRRAEERGPVTVRIFCPREEEIAAGVSEFVRIEATGWKGRRGSSLKQRPAMRQFFEQYALYASRSGAFRFAFLDVAGTPIAAQFAAIYADRYWVFKIGYDEAWSQCSPGWQLLGETIRYAFEQKLTSYEFLGSDEAWLHGWTTERRGYRTVSYYPMSWRGLYGLAADTIGRLKGRFMAAKKEKEPVTTL